MWGWWWWMWRQWRLMWIFNTIRQSIRGVNRSVSPFIQSELPLPTGRFLANHLIWSTVGIIAGGGVAWGGVG